MLTLVTQAFGARGLLGDLVLDPKLVGGQFDQEGKARLVLYFAGRDLNINYHNHDRLDYGDYRIHSVCLGGRQIDLAGSPVIIPRCLITSLSPDKSHSIEVELCSKTGKL